MSRFVVKSLTITMIAFVTFTLISVFMLSYTVYVYFGVCKAMRQIACDVNFTVSQGYMANMSIKTVLTVQNPSQLDLSITYVNEKFYLDSKLVGNPNGYWVTSYENPLALKASSNLDIVLNAPDIPVDEEQIVNLYAIFSIGINTPLPERVSLSLYKTLQDSV